VEWLRRRAWTSQIGWSLVSLQIGLCELFGAFGCEKHETHCSRMFCLSHGINSVMRLHVEGEFPRAVHTMLFKVARAGNVILSSRSGNPKSFRCMTVFITNVARTLGHLAGEGPKTQSQSVDLGCKPRGRMAT
jgi:hypothetical protein